MKKIIYYSCMCQEETYKRLFHDYEIMPGQQVQKYHRTMLAGLATAENVVLHAISKVPLDGSRTKKTVTKIPDEKWNGVQITYLPFVKIPKMGQLFQILSTFFKTLSVRKEAENFAILDVLNISMGIGASWACRLRKIPMIGIVTDLPQYLSESSDSSFVKACNKIMAKCDAYVVLTEQMNDRINPDGKPYIVIEGQADSGMATRINRPEDKYTKKVCLYSGNLNAENGIDYLSKGFLEANIEDAELHIYGNGDFVPQLKEICAEHEEVKYMGVRLNEEVVAAQLKATLLINPRPTHQEFVKYSFPSKNMEYMASGTPLLTTKLPGMPKEYEEYVYLLETETAEGIADAIEKLLCRDEKELHEKGLQAKTFILKHKSGAMQAKKIVDLINGIGK